MPQSGSKHFFEVDDIFANYTIVHFCGRGAYGEVYLAEDITHKTVALKIIPISSGSEVWRMELIGLRHYRQSIEDYRSLIEVFHVGETDDFFYYTMEAADNMLHGDSEDYISDTLAHRLERGGRLEPDKVLELAYTLLDALEHLYEHDLAHRDLKPANIVFVNGQAKLSDLGLISSTGVRSKVVGTVDFLPPEIADGDPVGYGHDLYSLGKVLYCALTGLLPENFPEVPSTVPLRAWRQFKKTILRACSTDPRMRFYTPADFRNSLPESIKETTFLDEDLENIHSYRKQHPVLWRIGSAALILTSIAFLVSGYLALRYRNEVRSMENSRIDFIFETIDMLNDCQMHLQRLSATSENKWRFRQLQVFSDLASEARASGDMVATERYCANANATLRVWAEEELRGLKKDYPLDPLPSKTADLLPLLEKYSNFAATPLYAYLLPASLDKVNTQLAALKNKLLDQWAGPVPGKKWQIPGDPDLNLVYIPAGNLPGEPQKSFWFGVNEVTCRSIRNILPYNNITLKEDDLPATNLTWNDRLDFCRQLTLQTQKNGTLPPGYIFRLPYADEWMFALHGGWTGADNFEHAQQMINDYAWYGGNSMYQLHPVRTRKSGSQGLFDLIGNAAESVLLKPTLPGQIPAVGNFGSSFRARRVSGELKTETQVDMLENNWSGFRIVLAPGSIDYFENNWFTGQTHAMESNDSVYEIIGGPRCRWTGNDAKKWSEILGGELAILHDRVLRKHIYASSLRLKELHCLVGAAYTNGTWQWQDKTAVTDGEWLNEKHPNKEHPFKYLVWDHGFWRGAGEQDIHPQFMIKYSANRKNTPDAGASESSLILKKFSVNNKKMWLLSAPVDWYTAKRLSEMLGGQLAVVDKAEDQQKLLEVLQEFDQQRIALGGFRKNGSWQWINGQTGPDYLPADTSNKQTALNSCFVSVYNNKLCNSAEFDGFVCEFP